MSSAEQFARGFTTQFASVLTCPSLNSLLESHLLEVTHDADLSDPHHVQQVIEGLVLQAASELPKRVPEELGERLRGSPAKSHRQIFVPGMLKILKPPLQYSNELALANPLNRIRKQLRNGKVNSILSWAQRRQPWRCPTRL